MAPADEWAEANREMWDERVAIHVESEFYDVEGFKTGKPALEPFEVDELGPLGGLRLVHLQCHFGLDTLDLVRLHPTLEAAGLDFSESAIRQATALAQELNLDSRATFLHAEVYQSLATFGPGAFDVVYTGKGALNWLPDLPAWAAQCAGLLKPGGWLYLCELHPIQLCLDEEIPAVKYDYFDTNVMSFNDPGTYADPHAATVHNRSYEWQHPLQQVFDAIIGAGLQLRFFHEWDYTIAGPASWLVKGDDSRYRWPGTGKLPLMYSLKAIKPAD